MSSISTYFASSFSFRVLDRDSGVMPDSFATFEAWVSVSAAAGASEAMLA